MLLKKKKAAAEKITATSSKSLSAQIKTEMEQKEKTGKSGKYLELIHEYLKQIKPTSVESERAFSTSGFICNKIRSSLKLETLRNICFLRSYFLHLNFQIFSQ